jgi:hypothetical protein
MDSLAQKLNLIGIVSLFGGEVALSAFHYSLLNENGIYSYAFVSPGLQTVSSKVFKRIDNTFAQSVSPGQRDDPKAIVGLTSVNNYKYVGLHSGTSMTVRNVLGEAVLRSSKTNKELELETPSRKNGVQRDIRLTIIKLGELDKLSEGIKLSINSSIYMKLVSLIIPLINIGSIVGLFVIEEYVIASVIVINIIANMILIRTTKANGCDYPKGQSSSASPIGDILVEDMTSSGNLWLILGKEDAIQYLFQKTMTMSLGKWEIWNFIAACIAYTVSIINIIAIPFGTFYGQLWFAVLLLFGLIQNITLASLDGDKLLWQLVNRMIPIDKEKDVQEYLFDNRTSALSYCTFLSGSHNHLALEELTPKSLTWKEWCKRTCGNNIDKINDGLLTVLCQDSDNALEILRRHRGKTE